MTATTYAREGYKFYQVITSGYFREVELPEDQSRMTPQQRRAWRRLTDQAEQLGVHIESSSYRRG